MQRGALPDSPPPPGVGGLTAEDG